MISIDALTDNFYPVVAVDNFVRCADELRDRSIYTYLLLPKRADDVIPILVSDDVMDDEFALELLKAAEGIRVDGLDKRTFTSRFSEMSHILIAPPHYHSELKGRFDHDRQMTALVIPVFDCEFSCSESVEEFRVMRRALAATLNRGRTVHPKISLRFDNRKTGGGTGDGYTLVHFNDLVSQIDNLRGMPPTSGFIEVINYKDNVIELVPSQDGSFLLIFDRIDDRSISVTRDEACDRLWGMVTGTGD